MRHFKSWALAICVIFSASQVLAKEYADSETCSEIDTTGNMYICTTHGPGSAKIVVQIDPAVINTLVADLSKRKDTYPPVSSAKDIPRWMGGQNYKGTGQDGHSNCYPVPASQRITNCDVDCSLSTYQCNYNRALFPKSPRNAGQFHGFVVLRREDIKGMRTFGEKLYDTFHSVAEMHKELRKAVDNVAQNSHIQDSIESQDDVWTHPSPCLTKRLNSVVVPKRDNTLRPDYRNLDYLEERCGHDDATMTLANHPEILKTSASGRESAEPLVTGRNLPTGYKGIIPQECEELYENDINKSYEPSCDVARRCTPQVFALTCDVQSSDQNCGLSQCLESYKSYCNEASSGCSQAGNYVAPATPKNRPTHAKLAEDLQNLDVTPFNQDYCLLYRTKIITNDKDDYAAKKLAANNNCSQADYSIPYLINLLKGRAEPRVSEFKAIKTYITSYAEVAQSNDPNVPAAERNPIVANALTDLRDNGFFRF